MAFPVKPTWMLTEEDCRLAVERGFHPCNAELEWNWLGTDDQGRDVVARVIYGFRLSVLFGLVLTIFSSIIGVAAGAVQGYFGGWTDLLFQRFIEIWTSVPQLYLLIIVAAVIEPNFWILLGILLAFSWVALVGVVRAEFLRARNFEYVTAARALGLSNIKIIFKHLLPNAMVATLTFMPFILNGSITTLTSLDFLGVRPAAGLALARRAAGARQGQSAGAVARPDRLLRHRHHAEPAHLHRRGGARRARPAQDLRVRQHARIALHTITATATAALGRNNERRMGLAALITGAVHVGRGGRRHRLRLARAARRCRPHAHRFRLAGARLVRVPAVAAPGRLEAHLRLRPLPGAGRLRQRACAVRHRRLDRLRGASSG